MIDPLILAIFSNLTNATSSMISSSGILSWLGVNSIYAFVVAFGYLAIFILIALESASLPIASEITLPLAGLFIARGLLNFPAVLAVAVVAGVVGFTIDYYIAYYLNKGVVYKHLELFHIKRARLEAFDRWFQKNGSFAVFSLRMVPILRGLISFPAGFAAMPKKKFYFYSIAGSLIWYVVLIGFGYYALSSSDLTLVVAAVAAMGVVMYLLYEIVLRKIAAHGH